MKTPRDIPVLERELLNEVYVDVDHHIDAGAYIYFGFTAAADSCLENWKKEIIEYENGWNFVPGDVMPSENDIVIIAYCCTGGSKDCHVAFGYFDYDQKKWRLECGADLEASGRVVYAWRHKMQPPEMLK